MRASLKLAVTGAALWWAFSRASIEAMAHATADLSAVQLGSAVVLLLSNVFVGALRWRSVIEAFGAAPPSLGFLMRAYAVANFYNTFVPGNVGGDALRAYVTRRLFRGAADSYAVVVLERGFGLSALLASAAVGIFLAVFEWRLLGLLLFAGALASTAAAALAPYFVQKLAHRLPKGIALRATNLSLPKWSGVFGSVVVLSMVSQVVGVLSSHLLVFALSPNVRFSDSLAFVSLAMLSLYIPISVSGLGVREAAFVVLFAKVGVSAADATAASLAFMAALMIVGLIGGVIHWFAPLELPSARRQPESATAEGADRLS